MRASVVIPTLDRVESLRHTLDALRRQACEDDFEVIVVDGPSTDGTAALLSELDDVRALRNPLRNLSVSRNLGIAAAGGEVVCFLDDDAIPRQRWLAELLAPLRDDPGLAATGGLVLDAGGTRLQWRHLVAHRTGEQDFDQEPPLDRFVGPGADPFLYVAGGCCAMRREALVQIGGFDEEIEYNFDETEACLRLLDAGWRLASLDAAIVQHGFLPSHQRSAAGFTDPFAMVKNRVYFGMSHAGSAALPSLNRFLSQVKADGRRAGADARFPRRADAAFHVGLRRAGQERRSATIPPPGAFVPFAARGTGAVVVTEDAAHARARADAGDEAHLLVAAAADAPYRVAYAEGVWTRSVPVRPRWPPGGDDRAAALALAAGDVHGRADRRRFPVDWEHEARAALDVLDRDAFVDAAFDRILGRAPRPIDRFDAHQELEAGATPQDLVRRLAQSNEAAARGVDPDVRLPPVPFATAHRELRAIWMAGDEDFARRLQELLGIPAGPVGDRLAYWRAGREHVREAVPAADRVLPDDVRTAPELGAELARLARLPDDEFVHGLYRLLLGRDPEPGGDAAYRHRLAGGEPRASLVHDIAASEEALRRGVDPAVVERLAAAMPGRGPLRAAIARLRTRRPGTRAR